VSALKKAKIDPAIGSSTTSVSPQLLHDLRSPLTQIIGYTEMLTEEAEDKQGSPFVADLEKIRAAGLRMLTLIEENFSSQFRENLTLTTPDRARTVAKKTTEVRPAPAGAPGVLLIVDDNATNQDVLSRRLKQQGHTIRAVSSGAEALQLMHEVSFDLVLLDIMMPDMDGYEVLGHIKTDDRLHHIPVIMISALHEVESVVRCIEAGAEDYLAKPFNPILLRARIAACLEKKRGRDREALLFEQLQKNYKRLQEVEQLRDDMRNMIVHDLRTPLTAVMIGVEMLEKHGALNETQREMMGIAIGGGKTLLGMINDLLDVEKMESGSTKLQYDSLSPAELVSDAVEQVSSLAEDGQTILVTEVAPGLPNFSADRNMLSRTLVNLIANAIKFTRSGTVTIRAFRDEVNNLRFEIRDTGEGIPSEAFERIFEKFGQLDSRNRVGTGLGLAFCKLAVEAHGGHIKVESTPGIGSTFSFTIPLASRA
jgi:signal transduction histidine kinase